MAKIAILVWIMLGTVLAGVGMTAVVATPTLAPEAMKLIPVVCIAGFLLAIPASVLVARRIA